MPRKLDVGRMTMVEGDRWVTDERTGKGFCLAVSAGVAELFGTHVQRETFVFTIPVWQAMRKNLPSGVIPTADSNVEWAESDDMVRIWVRKYDKSIPATTELPTALLKVLLETLRNDT